MGIYSTDPTGEAQEAWDATWADDSSFAAIDEDSGKVMHKLVRLSELIIATCKSHGLEPNVKPGKTNAMVRLVGKGSAGTKKLWFPDGKPCLRLAAVGMSIPIVPQYKHLGTVLDLGATMIVEARRRVALAADAYETARKIMLGNRALPLATRAGIFHMTVTPTLFNIAMWVPEGKTWDIANTAYSKLVRKLLVPLIGKDEVYKLPLAYVHWATNCWTLDLIAQRARISLLISLAKAGPDVLWANLQTEGTWFQQLQKDLSWLVDGACDHWPVCGEPGWPEWWHQLREHGPRVKRRVQKRLKETFAAQCEKHWNFLCLWQLHRLAKCKTTATTTVAWKCWPCDRLYSTKAKLSVHFYNVHKRTAEYRNHAIGTVCGACAKQFWTQGRLAAHLRASVACVQALQQHCKPTSKIAPGFGSRRRRQVETIEYTPALPVQTDGPVLQATQSTWTTWQDECYLALCDFLFSMSDEEPVQEKLFAIFAQQPLYQQEIQEIVDFTVSEARSLQNDPKVKPWQDSEFDNMLSILEMIRKAAEVKEKVSAETAVEDSYVDFCSKPNLSWSTLLPKNRDEHGTPVVASFHLSSSWEAEWKLGREAATVSAVLHNFDLFVPEVLRKAWSHVLNGERIELAAPPSFWRHPVAAPFRNGWVVCK